MHQNLLRAALVAVLSALVLALVACGGGGDSTSVESADLGPDPATMAPADTPFYSQVVLRPQGSMADDLNSALGKVLATDDPGGMIRDAIDSGFASDPNSEGFTYSNDVEPWLGNRVGVFLNGYDAAAGSLDGAAAIATTDPEAAQAFIDKASAAGAKTETDETYNGVDYKLSDQGGAFGVDGDFVIAGTEQGFKDAVDAGAGDSLTDNSDATSSLDAAPADSLFSLYVDTPAVVQLIESSGALSGAQLQQFKDQIATYGGGNGPAEAWGTVTDSSFAISASAPAADGASGPSELLSSFPTDSWFAFATANFGDQLQAVIEQFSAGFQSGFASAAPPGINPSRYDPLVQIKKRTGIDLKTDLAWIGDTGGFIEGTSLLGLGAGLVFEATDESAASDTLSKIQSALQGDPSVQISPSSAGEGFKLQPVGSPVGAEVALQDGKVVTAIGAAGVADVLSPADTLDGSDRFNTAKDALGDGETPSFFLDFAPILSLVEGTGQVTQDPGYQAARPYLSALDYLVAGSKLDGDRTISSFVLGVKQGSASSSDATAAVITP